MLAIRRVLTRRVLAVTMLAAGLVACGDDDAGPGTTTSPSTTPSTTQATTTLAPTTSAATTTVAPTTTLPATTTTTPALLEQPAIWPAADVVFTTPEAAAADFVTNVLQVPPTLGEFQAGDARSGEIEVFSPGEGSSGVLVPRGLLLLRQLGPSSGWFVIGAPNENATIATPVAGATVPAGPLTVSGVARGFEANVNVTAMVAGDASRVLDTEITMGGNLDQPEPYSVTLDLSGAEAGSFVMLLVRGGTGLETDPGDFGAVPVVIAS
jgi:hypothetical protein